MNERQLLSELKSGSAAALGEIIDRYSHYIYAIAANVLGDILPAEDVEEIVSDSFTALWYTRSSVQSGKLKAYLAAIARNKAISRLRAMHATGPLEDDVPILDCRQPESEALISELTVIARSAVDSLPEPDREIFQRHYFLYQKTGDISRDMGMNHATVRTRLARGRERLRLYLTERGYSCENLFD